MSELCLLESHHPDQTRQMAAALSTHIRPSDLLLLMGDLGSGKSLFARSLIQTRMAVHGVVEEVPSPSFTLVQQYSLPDGEIWHTDFYRLGDVSEFDELGLSDAIGQDIVIVEWPDRLALNWPANALMIHFETGETAEFRHIRLTGRKERWQAPIKALGWAT